MPILTPVMKLVVFRQSLRPHSAVAFLVEFLCFVLELLDKERDLAKILGIVCAFDTLIFTLLDLIQNLIQEEVKIRRYGQVFWLYTNDVRLYWHTLNLYLLILCIVHVIGSAISYSSRRHYLVLLPLFAAGLELVPQEAYRFLGNDQQTLQDYVGPDQEDSIGPIHGPLYCIQLEQGELVRQEAAYRVLGNDQTLQDYVEPDKEDCIGPIHGPLDGIELEQGDGVGIEVDQEAGDNIGPDGGP